MCPRQTLTHLSSVVARNVGSLYVTNTPLVLVTVCTRVRRLPRVRRKDSWSEASPADMVAISPNLTLTLEALGPHGALLPAEVKVALSHSLPLKEAELGVSGLTVWGRIHALNGKDYLIAQDGVDWATLGPVTPAKLSTASNMVTMLSGDPQKKHYWPPKPEDQEDAGEEGEQKDQVHEELTELQRLRAMVELITAQTDLAPVGSTIINADGAVISNPLFSGLQYPDKLEAYYHVHSGPKGRTAAEDVRGCWAIIHDKFRQTTVCRSLLFLGYTFYYNGTNKTWGGFYNGDGLKNNDLIFML